MVTETPDTQLEVWSDNLEEELVEAGMEPEAAKAYRYAFELGLTRVMSRFPTRQELFAMRDEMRGEIREQAASMRRDIDNLRREMRFILVMQTGLLGAILAVVISRL